MSPARRALPAYLLKYASEQHYDRYTSQDHAAWRYILRQNRTFFREHGVPIYLDGLKKTGITTDRIPRISDMDQLLSAFGWGAIPVQGFIPPAAFLDFQARAVLPIACDMRSVQHIAYTPAPDIVHEAAGHAPVLADQAYAKYLHSYALMAQKAIQSREDILLYEAIRYLSDIKENPDTAPEEVGRAEGRVKVAAEAATHMSETTMVTRMAWWTVEYGLVGDPKTPKIYGAGLLSSVGESQTCLSPSVRKIPLSVDCVNQSYDITEPQPQLFVARDMAQLVEVLEELEGRLAFRRGGVEGLRCAEAAKTVNTVVLSSGLAISGEVAGFLTEKDDPIFLRCTGPVQLATQSGTEWLEREGHGRTRHPQGFSGPIGMFKNSDRAPELLDDSSLEKLGIRWGSRSRLEMHSGFGVEGVPVAPTRHDGKLVLITWRDCTVRRGSELFFEPSWGEFDQPVGAGVVSVFGGPADLVHFGDIDIGRSTTTPGRTTPFSPQELRTFAAYQKLRELRDQKASEAEWQKLAEYSSREHASDWLLHLELLEVALAETKRTGKRPAWGASLDGQLEAMRATAQEPEKTLITKGLALAAVGEP